MFLLINEWFDINQSIDLNKKKQLILFQLICILINGITKFSFNKYSYWF